MGKMKMPSSSPFTLLATETMFLGYTLAEGLVRVLNVAVWHKETRQKKSEKDFQQIFQWEKQISKLFMIYFA